MVFVSGCSILGSDHLNQELNTDVIFEGLC